MIEEQTLLRAISIPGFFPEIATSHNLSLFGAQDAANNCPAPKTPKFQPPKCPWFPCSSYLPRCGGRGGWTPPCAKKPPNSVWRGEMWWVRREGRLYLSHLWRFIASFAIDNSMRELGDLGFDYSREYKLSLWVSFCLAALAAKPKYRTLFQTLT